MFYTLKQKIFYAHLAIFGANLIYAINYGFAKDVISKLPMEFAVEANNLLAITLEGSVG